MARVIFILLAALLFSLPPDAAAAVPCARAYKLMQKECKRSKRSRACRAKSISFNRCNAEQSRAAQPGDVCLLVYSPVCALNGAALETYSNECFVLASGASVVSEGPCPAAK